MARVLHRALKAAIAEDRRPESISLGHTIGSLKASHRVFFCSLQGDILRIFQTLMVVAIRTQDNIRTGFAQWFFTCLWCSLLEKGEGFLSLSDAKCNVLNNRRPTSTIFEGFQTAAGLSLCFT